MKNEKQHELINSLKKQEGESSTVDYTKFIQLIGQYNSETLKDFLQTFSNDLIKKLWNNIHDRVMEIIETKLYLQLVQEDEQPSDKKEKIINELEFLDCVATVSLQHVEAIDKLGPESFIETLIELHGILFDIGVSEEGVKLQSSIASVCEKAYLKFKEDKNADKLVPQTISYLLAKSLEFGAKSSDVKRVYQMRHALTLLDHEEESIMQELLLRAAISPLYLSTQEGKKFLIFVFTFHPNLTALLHTAIVPQIAASKKSILESYGEIYFKSWKNAQGQVLLELESSCIQDYMYHAIHARDITLFNNIRVILDAFHSKKKIRGIDEMLLKLYEPILFRSLSVANSMVRRNAACLFIDAFPLRDPEANKEDADKLLQKQFELLKTLLYDDNPNVRSVAVEGVCRVLGVYWELIPPETTFAFLKTLVTQMAFDGHSALVRASVCRGLSYVLDNHLSQSVLKKLIPHIKPLIHDTSQQVRNAFLDLLIRIKSIRSIKFYDIVTIDDILRRITVDSSSSVTKICNLLMNSYFPYNKPASDQFKRYLDMAKRNSMATKVFYTNVVQMAPTSASVKFIHILNKFLKKVLGVKKKQNKISEEVEHDEESSPKPKTKKRKLANKKKKDDEKDEEEENEDNKLKQYEEAAKDIPLIELTLEVISSMMNEVVLYMTKDEEKNLFPKLTKEFSTDHLYGLTGNFKSFKVSAAVWSIVKHLPKDTIESFIQNSMTKLEKMCEDGKLQNDYTFILDCICKWKMEKKVLKMIEDNLSLQRKEGGTQKKGRKKRKTNESKKVDAPFKSASIALVFLTALFELPNARRRIFSEKCEESLKKVMKQLYDIASTRVCECLESETIDQNEEEFLIAAFHTYNKLVLHQVSKDANSKKIQNKSGKAQVERFEKIFKECPKDLMELLILYNETMLPSLYRAGIGELLKDVENIEEKQNKRKRDDESQSQQKEVKLYYPLGICIAKSMCMFVGEMIALGMIRHLHDDIPSQISQFIYGFLQEPLKILLPHIYPHLMKIIYQMIQADFTSSSAIQLLHEIIGFYANNINEEKEKKNVMNKKYVLEIMTLIAQKEIHNQFVQLALEKCVKIIEEPNDIHGVMELYSEESKNIPKFILLCLELLSKSQKFFKQFLVELSDKLTTDIQDVKGLYKALQISSVLVHFNISALEKYEREFTETLEYVLTSLSRQEGNLNIISLIEELISHMNDKLKELKKQKTEKRKEDNNDEEENVQTSE